LDNAGKFTSQAFNNFCIFIGIVVEHRIAHIHTQNGLAKLFIKQLQLIVRPLLIKLKKIKKNYLHLFGNMLYYILHL
jgi:hypothetical protein